jgi:hypothetical protein
MAGLSIECCKSLRNKLVTRYRGRLADYVKAGFISNPDRIMKSKAKVRYYDRCCDGIFHPVGASPTLRRMGDDDYRMSFTEDLPIDSADMGNGVRLYWFQRQWTYKGKSFREMKKIFIAKDCETLIRAGVAGTEIKRDDGYHIERRYVTEGGNSHSVELWTIRKDRRGFVRYTVYPENLARKQRHEAERNLAEFEQPDEWLEQKEDWLCRMVEVVLGEQSAVNTKGGSRYSLRQADVTAVRCEIEAAIQRIRDIGVKVTLPHRQNGPAVKDDRVESAGSDDRFQKFMRAALKDVSNGTMPTKPAKD